MVFISESGRNAQRFYFFANGVCCDVHSKEMFHTAPTDVARMWALIRENMPGKCQLRRD